MKEGVSKMMAYEEFMEMYYERIDAEGIDESVDYCEGCPYRDRCHSEEIFWGCGVWEDSMGEDL
jgi:hypothetical protein